MFIKKSLIKLYNSSFLYIFLFCVESRYVSGRENDLAICSKSSLEYDDKFLSSFTSFNVISSFSSDLFIFIFFPFPVAVDPIVIFSIFIEL